MFKEIVNFIKNNKWYVLLVVGLLGLYFYKFHGELSSNSEKWDHFGSYIGGIFSAVTLLSVLHGMQLERKRFNEQKSEFEKERQEQEERRRKEDFERTFFMMLEQHNIKLRELEKHVSNNDSLVDEIYNKVISSHSFNKIRDYFRKDDKLYSEIDSYFLNLYRILKFIHKNREFNINNEYSGLLRSFLSRKILLILAYHLCDREEQYNDYIHYVNEFHFLEHLNLTDLEFRFLSGLTGFDKEELYTNFLKYRKDNSIFFASEEYYPDNNEIWKKSYEKFNNYELVENTTNLILDIFDKKINFKEILSDDLIITDDFENVSEGYKDGLSFYMHDENGNKYLNLNSPPEVGISKDNIYLHILNTFSERAFSTEQEKNFKEMKVLCKMFLEYLGNKQ